MADEPNDDSTDADILFAPLPGDPGAHGPYRDRERGGSSDATTSPRDGNCRRYGPRRLGGVRVDRPAHIDSLLLMSVRQGPDISTNR